VIADASDVLIDGPWTHRFVSANGARFHVAESGSGPLILLLHGFPQFWWTWRYLLPVLATSGYRAAAMDLRGYGASDKPPRGYDTLTLANDVAGVIRGLGESQATIIGHDWGAWLAWSMPATAPRVTRAVVPMSMGHPLQMLGSFPRNRSLRSLLAQAAFQIPIRPERDLEQGTGVDRILRQWSATDFPDHATLKRYRRAMQMPFVAHTSMEYYRWVVRSRLRPDGRRFVTTVRRPIHVPVLYLHGAEDTWVTPESAAGSAQWARGGLGLHIIPSAGHFLPEEAPDAVANHLLPWLEGVHGRALSYSGD
jgi:pimeloyl-ACP methyl ester carboxylesterase